ncbi:hypothetical protein B0H19DRAFT_1253875 [Mycena capillaripes]|nr:hypothetical protein B0H19DRAFT_1253875 [Mycena capillaripes]
MSASIFPIDPIDLIHPHSLGSHCVRTPPARTSTTPLAQSHCRSGVFSSPAPPFSLFHLRPFRSSFRPTNESRLRGHLAPPPSPCPIAAGFVSDAMTCPGTRACLYL